MRFGLTPSVLAVFTAFLWSHAVAMESCGSGGSCENTNDDDEDVALLQGVGHRVRASSDDALRPFRQEQQQEQLNADVHTIALAMGQLEKQQLERQQEQQEQLEESLRKMREEMLEERAEFAVERQHLNDQQQLFQQQRAEWAVERQHFNDTLQTSLHQQQLLNDTLLATQKEQQQLDKGIHNTPGPATQGSQGLPSAMPWQSHPYAPKINRKDELFEACRAKWPARQNPTAALEALAGSSSKTTKLKQVVDDKACYKEYDSSARSARSGNHGFGDVVLACDPHAVCSSDHSALLLPTTRGLLRTCCPTADVRCAGCGQWYKYVSVQIDADGERRVGVCLECHGGYTKINGTCIACLDTVGWLDDQGRTCTQLQNSGCTDVRVRGLSSNQACCHCGGGHPSGTPFEYKPVRQAVGLPVVAFPVPRTASLYSLNEGCDLAKFGLTLNGTTGVVNGTPNSKEPFSVECEVTSHQSGLLTFTTSLKIMTSRMIYAASTLSFVPVGAMDYVPRLDPSYSFKDFAFKCAPDVQWAGLDGKSGTLSLIDGDSSIGAVTRADNDFEDQDGGVCVVSANGTARDAEGSNSLVHTAVVVLRPRPWPRLAYPTGDIAVTIGESAPRLAPREFQETGLQKPLAYTMACTNGPPMNFPSTLVPFEFDEALGTGFLAGHPLLELRSDGSLAISPASSLSGLFDSEEFLVNNFPGVRKVTTLVCRIFGRFEDAMLSPVSAWLKITIRDNVCFVQQSIIGVRVSAPLSVSSLTSCRQQCRLLTSCTHYDWFPQDARCFFIVRSTGAPSLDFTDDLCPASCTNHSRFTSHGVCRTCTKESAGPFLCWSETDSCSWSDATSCTACRQARYDPEVRGKEMTAWAKVTECSDETTCIELQKSASLEAYLAGLYRPQGQDVIRGTVYKKSGPTPEERLWLVKYDERADPPIRFGQCADGEYLIRRVDSSVDYVNLEQGHFELRGPLEHCIREPDLVSAAFSPKGDGEETARLATRGCLAPKNLTEQEEADDESESTSSLSSMILGDPLAGDRPYQDFWLHPCDCVPPAWGSKEPVDPGAFAEIPPQSQNRYVPKAFVIVEGQFVCDMPYLIRIDFETEEDAYDRVQCEAECKLEDSCNFYWTGVQHEAATCRLYQACDNLVREFGLLGELVALPRQEMCRVSNPEQCWASSLRRQALNSSSPSWESKGVQFLRLHQQCDQALLLGGVGVEQCARPTYRSPSSHRWSHKRPLPLQYAHGEAISMMCWGERFVGYEPGGSLENQRQVICNNGRWFDMSNQKEGFDSFKCVECVQLSKSGYREHQARKKQELAWTDFFEFKIRSSLRSHPDEDEADVCLPSDSPWWLERGQNCEPVIFKHVPQASEASRMLVPSDNRDRCFRVNTFGGLEKTRCDPTEPRQLIPAHEIPKLLADVYNNRYGSQIKEFIPSDDRFPRTSLTNDDEACLPPCYTHGTYMEHGVCRTCTSHKGSGTPKCLDSSCSHSGTITSCTKCGIDMYSPELRTDGRPSARCPANSAMRRISFAPGLGVDCNFAPIMETHYGNIPWTHVPYGTPRSGTASGSRWRHQLAGVPVTCGTGKALIELVAQSVDKKGFPGKVGISYKCTNVAGMGACMLHYSAQVDADLLNFDVLREMPVQCPLRSLINDFQLEHSASGSWVRWKFWCCSTTSIPTVIQPLQWKPSSRDEDVEGKYCPVSKDRSGRFKYEKTDGDRDNAVPLEYDPAKGAWVFGSSVGFGLMEAVEPFGTTVNLTAGSLDVVHITDFDGVFVGNGVPEQRGASRKAALRALRAPKPPKPVPKPKLEEEDFTKTEWAPQYASECKFDSFDGDPKHSAFVWERLHDTVNGKPHEEPLQYTAQYLDDEGKPKAELPAEHPCKVAQNAGGIFDDKWTGTAKEGGGPHDKLGYDALFRCSTREIERGRNAATGQYRATVVELSFNEGLYASDGVCAAVPTVITAPLGVGVGSAANDICKAVAESAVGLAHVVNRGLAAHNGKLRSYAGSDDCDPLQVNMARMFCDMHCVRDAVVRGDLNLRRVIDAATRLTNKNLDKLTTWSVDSMMSQTNYLADKLNYLKDYMDIQFDYLQPAAFLQEARSKAGEMLGELQRFAREASLDSAARTTAQRAAKKFLKTANQVDVMPNASLSHYVGVLEEVASVHATLHAAGGGRTKRSTAGLLLVEGVRHMQDAVKTSLSTIGIYTKHSALSKKTVRSWSRARSTEALLLIELDKVWWKLRAKLDDYLEVASDHMLAFSNIFNGLAGYQECSVGFTELAGHYNAAMEARERSHQQLKETWKDCANLLGELASIISDAGIFDAFLAEQGCNSTLAAQTLKQVHLSVGAMQFLQHRFAAGGLGSPDVAPVNEAAQRVEDSFAASRQGCKAQ